MENEFSKGHGGRFYFRDDFVESTVRGTDAWIARPAFFAPRMITADGIEVAVLISRQPASAKVLRQKQSAQSVLTAMKRAFAVRLTIATVNIIRVKLLSLGVRRVGTRYR